MQWFAQGCTQPMVSNNNKTLAERVTPRVRGLRPPLSGGIGGSPWLLAMAAVFATLSACGGGSSADNASPPPTVQALSASAVAGEALFHDKSLSASGQQSCSTCHVKSHAFAGDPAVDNGLPVPLGGRNMDEPGFRNAPSLMYAAFTPAFSIEDGTASGGFFRDGRASSLAAQAVQPFVSSLEMANQDAAEVLSRLQSSPATLQKFMAAFGSNVLNDPTATLNAIGTAIAAYETEDVDEFQPFSSKFDYYVDGKVQLTDRELNGLALFNNPGKGNCTSCHPSVHQEFTSRALFTDFSYDNIGIPRNWNIPANAAIPLSPISGQALSYMPTPVNVPSDAEYTYYDLGLCGPFVSDPQDGGARPDLVRVTNLCGAFKVPTLRNVALTAPYFHNGVFADLHKVVEWYVARDVNNNTANNPTPVPAGPGGNPYQTVGTFYTAADGTPDLYQYNDLPAVFDGNVNAGEVPYTAPTLAGGNAPTLTAQEIDDLVAFLCTLTDGYDPNNRSAYNVPSQCQPVAGQ
jgi:cytochrome c peroxidase